MYTGLPCVLCSYLLCFILIALTKDAASFQLKPSAGDFSRHSIVTPKLYSGREKREIACTKNHDGLHRDKLTLTLPIEEHEYTLDLHQNRELIPAGHTLSYQEDGKMVHHKPSLEELDLCYYHGTVRGKPGSWAAVSTCDGVSGVIYDGKNLKHIEPASDDNTITGPHYVYDHKHLMANFPCGYSDGITNNTNFDHHLHLEYTHKKNIDNSRISRYKRAVEEPEVRGPYNANKLSRYVELVLVIDNRGYKANGDNLASVHKQCKDIANIINAVYAPLNIFIALVGVVVWKEVDEISLLENGDTTLTNFLIYRREKLLKMIPNDNAQLLTRQKFSGGVVGKALKGPICTYEFSGGVSTNHSEVISLVATTIAHEMGHNFGMEHDTEEDCKCPDEKCIMSPSSTSQTPVHWSSCSKDSLALALERGMDYCLRNKPVRLFDSPQCGNGFVEPGEQCDCGASGGACAACCHADTCMLRSNATCATGECCDLQTCRAKTAGTLCRSADQECDLPEYCTGYSEYCPNDVFKMDSIPCNDNQAYCYSGSCRTHTDQCKLLWGQSGKRSHDKCFEMNRKGTKHGNCGYDRPTQYFPPCSQEDILCGMLHCQHLNEQLEFGMESVSTLAHTFINHNGTIIPCRTAIVDLGLTQVDPGLVPDGAKCGDEKMCVKQRCTKVEVVRKLAGALPDSVCPSDCSGRGVCNSQGHCHCDVGFAPPLCATPGHGGSHVSGPATDPNVQRKFMVAMYVIFLGIIPTIILLLFLTYYSRHNVVLWWKKPRKSSPSPKKGSLQRRISRGASKFAANFQSSSHIQNQSLPPINVHSITSPDDMSSSLLRSDSDNSPSGNANPGVTFFGNFKGFSLTPLERAQVNNTKNEPKAPPVAVIGGYNNSNDNKNVPKQNQTVVKNITEKSAKITPVHRSSSNSNNHNVNNTNKPILRSAPPLPVVPVTAKPQSPKLELKRNNSSVQDRIKALMGVEKTENQMPINLAPIARPTISSPILEASTCTAKELISPLQGSKTLGPLRTAPTLPEPNDAPKRPLSIGSNVLLKPLPEEPKKVKEGISLNRIASFLKQEKPTKEKERTPVERSHSLPKNSHNQVKLPKIVDKATLRNLQISNPILQKEIDLPVNTVSVLSDTEDDEPKPFVSRAQSMRGPAVSQKPAIQSFGSMRQPPGVTRPLSVAGRPTAPPPPRPDQGPKPNTIPGVPGYQNPKEKEKKVPEYVDCIAEKQAPLAHIDEESPGDNIYAVIEENPVRGAPNKIQGVSQPIKTIPQPPPEGYIAPKPINSNSGSSESMGLLGEIVSEIQTRNFDSIYSTSTLARKKKEREKKALDALDSDSTYVNTDPYANSSESEYTNMGGVKSSAASTTSSGYLNPSAVNVPTFLKKQSFEDKTESNEKAPPSPTLKGPNTKIPMLNRQVTPPGLRTPTFQNASPKNTPKLTPKSFNTNSPDVVSSCALPQDLKNVKAPDVVNNNTTKNNATNDTASKVTAKPTTAVKPAENRPPVKPNLAVNKKTPFKPNLPSKTTPSTNKISEKNAPNKVSAKVDSNVKSIADNLNKNKPKPVPKPTTVINRTDSNLANKPSAKLTAKPSNVASLQQKFENRKSLGRELSDK